MRIFKSKLFIFALAIILAGSIIMIAAGLMGGSSPIGNGVGVATTPMQRIAGSVGDFFYSIFGYFYRYNMLQQENESYKEQLENYRKLESAYYAAVSENEQLRELTKLQQKHTDFDMIPANIVSTDDSFYQSGFTVDRGTMNGVKVGDCVIVNAGIVGYIHSVGLNYSEVRVITDMQMKLGGMISRTRDTVVVEGTFELHTIGRIRLSYLRNDADIQPSDLVETSGYGGMFPPGLLIGIVEKFDRDDNGISSYAIVKPIVDFSTLKSVFIVREFTISD